MRQLLNNLVDCRGKTVEKIIECSGYNARAILFTDGTAFVQQFYVDEENQIYDEIVRGYSTHYKQYDAELINLLHWIEVITGEESKILHDKRMAAEKQLIEEKERKTLETLLKKYGTMPL